MIHLREQWEGVCLSQDYTLERCLGGDDNAAFFQTSLAPDGRRAVVKVVPESVVDGGALLELWHRTRQLRHSNLIELLDCGRADHGGETVCYAVFEASDDTLTSALSRSPLDRQEAREVLDSVLEALRYLHAQGLVLGALDTDHIVAVGDRIKLSTDSLRDAAASAAYRKDVRLLGNLWQQALMSASPKSSEIAAHAADLNPQTRWTLAEISAALNAPLPTVPPPAPPPPAASPVSVPRRVHQSPCLRLRWLLGAIHSARCRTCHHTSLPEMDFRGRRRSSVVDCRSQPAAFRRCRHATPCCVRLAACRNSRGCGPGPGRTRANRCRRKGNVAGHRLYLPQPQRRRQAGRTAQSASSRIECRGVFAEREEGLPPGCSRRAHDPRSSDPPAAQRARQRTAARSVRAELFGVRNDRARFRLPRRLYRLLRRRRAWNSARFRSAWLSRTLKPRGSRRTGITSSASFKACSTTTSLLQRSQECDERSLVVRRQASSRTHGPAPRDVPPCSL